jgi:arylsulfatase A-like enzyme
LAPTLLDLADAPAMETMDGKSLVPLLADKDATVHESLLFMQTVHSMSSRSLTVYRPPWKYTWWYFAGGDMEPTEELFNLALDPLEMHNRAGDIQVSDTLEQMRGLYDRHLAVFRRQGVNVNDYARHKLLFDRHEPWKKKARLVER